MPTLGSHKHPPRELAPSFGKRPKTQRGEADAASNAVAHKLHMRPTPASGAVEYASKKTDALGDYSAMEHKHTRRQSFSVSVALLQKLCRQANTATSRTPVFAVTFETAADVPKQWVLLPVDALAMLYERAGGTANAEH